MRPKKEKQHIDKETDKSQDQLQLNNESVKNELDISYTEKTEETKRKKTKDLKEYYKNYHKSDKWKEYLSTYVSEHKDILNKKKRDDRKNKKEIQTIIKNCILQNTIYFVNIEELEKCCKLSDIEFSDDIKQNLLYKK
jgi:hypothetical protein